MLPRDGERRRRVGRRVLGVGATRHAAVEEQVVARAEDVDRLEILFQVHAALEHAWRPGSSASL